LFQLGCWLAFATAGVHLVGHLLMAGTVGPAVLVDGVDRPSYVILVPGQDVPTPEQVADGLSLAVALLLGTLGATGLVVHRRGQEDAVLLRGVARAYAIGSAVLLVIAVLNFFSLQAFFIATMALCFALAAVSEG
jgi:hypothetical protein